jgi:hypothetical protein
MYQILQEQIIKHSQPTVTHVSGLISVCKLAIGFPPEHSQQAKRLTPSLTTNLKPKHLDPDARIPTATRLEGRS